MSKLKNNSGITLVALIITIIVLLILAIVSINLVMNGGIIDKSKHAVDKYSDEEVQEQIKLAYSEWQMGQFTGETRTAAAFMQDKLNDIYGAGAVTSVTESNGTFTVEFANGKEYSYNVTTGVADLAPEKPKITGVDYSTLKVGDYVNYPVYYNNVGTWVDTSNGQVKGNYPRDEYTGWRILSVDTTNNEVKLVSAGVPMSYYHGNDSSTSVTNLTTNFFSTPINSTVTQNNFYQCGFKEAQDSATTISNIANLRTLFANSFTQVNGEIPKVQVMTKDELDAAKTDVNSSDYKSSDLLAIPCKGNESSEYAQTWLASAYNDYYLWNVDYGGDVYRSSSNVRGARPVVSLKSGIKFAENENKINSTTTYDIYE